MANNEKLLYEKLLELGGRVEYESEVGAEPGQRTMRVRYIPKGGGACITSLIMEGQAGALDELRDKCAGDILAKLQEAEEIPDEELEAAGDIYDDRILSLSDLLDRIDKL